MQIQTTTGAWFFGLFLPWVLHAQAPAGLPNVADLAEELSPTVVFIESTQHGQAVAPGQSQPWYFFFHHGEDIPRMGAGSGVIVSPQGYIITNHHVVVDADEISVTLQDGRVFDARVMGSDPEIDLAVLKIEAEELKAAAFGESASVRVGDWVLAIGNPLGYTYSVTFGIVSALGRGAVYLNSIENYIQTDAAINRGNSGGPLIDMQGRVIGINTAISAAGQNIGFAVPIDMILPSYEQILKYGKVSRGALGITMQELTSETKKSLGVFSGALVNQVVPGSPADAAGLQPGDLIVGLDQVHVKNRAHLQSLVAVRRPGDEVGLEIRRADQTLNLPVTLGDRQGLFRAAPPATPPDDEAPELASVLDLDRLGLSLAPNPVGFGRGMGGETRSRGLVVVRVDPRGPAQDKGIDTGLLVLKINGLDANVGNLDAIRASVQEADKPVLLWIQDGMGARAVAVRPE